MKNNHDYILEGEYVVTYEIEQRGAVYQFRGVCENFSSVGSSVFWNNEKNEMLIIPTYKITELRKVGR